MSLPAPRKLSIVCSSMFGIAIGAIGVAQKLIMFAICVTSASALFTRPSVSSIPVCVINLSNSLSSSFRASKSSACIPGTPKIALRFTLKHTCMFGNLIPRPANKLHMISRNEKSYSLFTTTFALSPIWPWMSVFV